MLGCIVLVIQYSMEGSFFSKKHAMFKFWKRIYKFISLKIIQRICKFCNSISTFFASNFCFATKLQQRTENSDKNIYVLSLFSLWKSKIDWNDVGTRFDEWHLWSPSLFFFEKMIFCFQIYGKKCSILGDLNFLFRISFCDINFYV